MGHLRVTIDAFNKEKALVGEFSGHCEILAKFVDSSRKEHPCSRTARLLSTNWPRTPLYVPFSLIPASQPSNLVHCGVIL